MGQLGSSNFLAFFHTGSERRVPDTGGFKSLFKNGGVLICGEKRQRTGALQDAVAPAMRPFANSLKIVCANFILGLAHELDRQGCLFHYGCSKRDSSPCFMGVGVRINGG